MLQTGTFQITATARIALAAVSLDPTFAYDHGEYGIRPNYGNHAHLPTHVLLQV